MKPKLLIKLLLSASLLIGAVAQAMPHSFLANPASQASRHDITPNYLQCYPVVIWVWVGNHWVSITWYACEVLPEPPWPPPPPPEMPDPPPCPPPPHLTNNLPIKDLYALVLQSYNLTNFCWMDTSTNPPAPYYAWASIALTNMAVSNDLQSWTNISFQSWRSTNGMMTVMAEGAHPVATNYTFGNVKTGMSVNFWMTDSRKFYRLPAE